MFLCLFVQRQAVVVVAHPGVQLLLSKGYGVRVVGEVRHGDK